MAAPWERYQATTSEDGPWAKYASAEPMTTSDAVSALDVINQPVQPKEPASKPYKFDPFKRIYGAAEAATTIASGLPAMLVGNVSGAVSSAFGADPEKVRSKVTESMTYSPRSEYGRAILGDIGKALESDAGKLIQGLPVTGQELPMLAQAARQIRPAMELRGAEAAIKASDEGWANAARIEAAQSARKLGLTVPSNTTLEKMIGQSSMSEALAKANAPKVQELVKRDIGVSKNSVLNKETYDSALEAAGKSRNEIRGISSFVDDGTTLEKVRALVPDELIGNEAAARKVAKIIQSAEQKISSGMTGEEIIQNISQLRKDASLIRKMDNPGPTKSAKADAMIGIANALEDMVELNLASDPSRSSLLNAFKEGRARQAKVYMYKNATDMNTNTVDPLKIARLTAKDNAITGIGADIGKIAGVFPEAAGIAPTTTETFMKRHASRFGLSGLAGGAVGTLFGNPVAGAVAGGAAGEILAPIVAKRIAESGRRSSFAEDPRLGKYQQSAVSPAPISIPYTRTYPPIKQSGLAIAEESEGIPYAPFAQEYRAQKAMEARQPDTFIQRMQSANTEKQRGMEQVAESKAVAQRIPSDGGMLFDFDPITGRLRQAAQESASIPKASDISTASQKIASGQRFAMSAEERIAWDKAKVDVEKAAPQLRGLSDEAVAAKIADRQWVSNRIEQLKTEYADWAKNAADKFNAERAKIVNEIANSKQFLSKSERDARKAANAEAARRMQVMIKQRKAEMQANIDALEQMSETLSKPRAGSGIYVGQGPKTREFQRGMLTGE